MSEEHRTPPSDDAADVDSDQAVTPATGATARRVFGRSRTVEGWLLIVVLLVTIVFIGAAGSLVLYVSSMRDAPRTAAERQIATDEVAAKEQPQVVENWARLALSYANAGRWSDAASAIAKGRTLKKAAILDLVEADILRLRGDAAAIEAYDRAIKSGQVEYDELVRSLRDDKGVTQPPSPGLLVQAMTGRAYALAAAGRTQEAADQALQALKIEPTDASLLAALGDMYAKLGRTADAEKQYREALTFVPDLQVALDGLKRLGKE
jgi:tetratricopeptide (TPR) repeat protein